MIFAHEYKVKPESEKSKRIKRAWYPQAPATSDRIVFYDRALSQSFGNRFSYKKFVKETPKNSNQDKSGPVLVKKKR